MCEEEITKKNQNQNQKSNPKQKKNPTNPNQPTTHNYFQLKQLTSKTTTTIGPSIIIDLEQTQEAKLSAGWTPPKPMFC